MSSVFNIASTVGGSQGASPSAGASAFPNLTAKTTALRIVTDGFLRVQFASMAGLAVATASSVLFAPGESIVEVKDRLDFYSVMAVTGTANYSISLITVDPTFGG